MSGVKVTEWEDRIRQFWESADDAQPELMLRVMGEIVAERADDDPDALYEWASVHDFLGREGQAVPLYEAALAAGLKGAREPQAVVQLASSLRNIGRPEAAVEILSAREGDDVTGQASRAFLALALRDCGRHDEALRVALRALAQTLPLYRAAVVGYAEALTNE